MLASRVLRHEWRGLTADALVWILVSIFVLATGYGLVNGVRWVSFQKAAIAEATREERDRHAASEADIRRINSEKLAVPAFADPRNADAAGRRMASRYAVMPPADLAPMAIGQTDLLPYYFRMTTEAKESVLATTELENPQRLLAGRFDLAFVIIYLFPLLILALAYNLLSAEKEQGTLALALSQPTSLRTLVLLKIAPRLLLFFALIVACAVAAALAAGLPLTSAAGLTRLLTWIGIVSLYGLFWFVLAVAVAALDKPSAANAVILAGAWVLFVMLVPSALNLLAETWYPVPSRVRLVQAVREASDEATAAGSQLLSRYYEDHPELAPAEQDAATAMSDFNAVRIAVADDVDRRVRPVIEEYARQLAGQQRLVERLRFLSPAVLLQDGLNDLAGAGAARHRHFLTQVEAYHAAWRAWFQPRVLRRQPLADYRGVPTFHYQEESLRAVLARTAVAAGDLAIPVCLLGLLAAMGLRRGSRIEIR
jgi:ABC-2 type transport system permease protein